MLVGTLIALHGGIKLYDIYAFSNELPDIYFVDVMNAISNWVKDIEKKLGLKESVKGKVNIFGFEFTGKGKHDAVHN
jgi:hypothetical protein